MVTRVYIVRHCEAMGNLLGQFQGSTDCDITEKGERQLQKLSERLKDVHFDVVYSSPYIRAMKTAKAGIGDDDNEIIVCKEIAEINGGAFEGKKWKDLPVLYPEEYDIWLHDFGSFKAPDGESVSNVYLRLSKAFIKIITENRGKTIGFFSHGCSIRALLCFIKGLPVERISETDWSDNTAISLIEADENGNMKIVYENDSSHIENDESTVACKRHWG